MNRVGITGSRLGMTQAQAEAWRRLLEDLLVVGAVEVHHGDCVGVDAAATLTAAALGCRVVVHPPTDPKARAFCPGDLVLPPRPYLDRNHDIVDATDLLVAMPRGLERLRSGTWATVRYARRVSKEVLILALA